MRKGTVEAAQVQHVDAHQDERTVRTARQKKVRSAIDASAFICMALVVAASLVITVMYS